MSLTYALSPTWKIVLLDMGLAPDRVLRRAALPADLFSRGQIRLSPEQYHDLWRALEAEAGPALPLMVARALSVEAFDPPLFAGTCCPDLLRAAARIAEFKPLIGPMKLDVQQTTTTLSLTVIWPDGIEPPGCLGQVELLFWVALARLTTRAEVQPARVTAPVLPADPAGFRAYLGGDITEAPDWSITFRDLDARRPFLTANEPMWDFFRPELRRRLSELDQDATVGDRVRASLLEALPAGEATMDAVARKLAVSTRTLQRRLSREGTTFQEVLAATRELLARHYLKSSQMPAAEISFLLGYEDPNSFYRAFHAWTGSTPETVRAASGLLPKSREPVASG